MSSSADIREILQISPPKEPIQKPPTKPIEKRPGLIYKIWLERKKKRKSNFHVDGISRELYQLIGGAPPVAFVKPTLKSRLNKQRVTPW